MNVVLCALLSACCATFGPIGVEPVNKAWLREVNSFPLTIETGCLCVLTSLQPDLIWFVHVVV